MSAACAAASSIHPLNKAESRVFADYPTDEGPVLQRQPTFDACNNFPFDSPALNAVSLHPRILGAVSQVLEKPVHHVRMTQAALNGKYGPEKPRPDGVQFEFSWGNQDGNQPMHQDYGTLQHQHAVSAVQPTDEALYTAIYRQNYVSLRLTDYHHTQVTTRCSPRPDQSVNGYVLCAAADLDGMKGRGWY